MFCKNCGKQAGEGKKFCTNCGTSFPEANGSRNSDTLSLVKAKVSKLDARQILSAIVILSFVGYGIYSSQDESAIKTNNDALINFNSGNSQQAITQLQEASNKAISDENKVNSLKNLAYIYSTDQKNDLALSTFREAVALTHSDSFDYYLISGEIALLEGKPNAAQINYNKAYQLDPNNFQINNALAIFYLDLEEVAPQFSDYKKALTYAQKAYSSSGKDGLEIARQNLGIAQFFNDNYDQAISLLLQTNLNQHPFVNLWLGFSYAGKGDVSNAKIYFQRGINAGVEVPQLVHDYLATH